MNSTIYFLSLSFIFMVGIYLLFYSKEKIADQKLRDRTIGDYVKLAKKGLTADTAAAQELFHSAQLPITVQQYQYIRLAAVGVFVLYGGLNYVRTQDTRTLILGYLLVIALYVLSLPQMKILGFSSPFMFLVKKLTAKRQKDYDKELYKAVGHLKSICITNQDHPKSGDAIIEELMRYTNLTRPIFAQTLSLLRLQQQETARSYFNAAIGTKFGRDFSRILLDLDSVDPKEFIDQLKAFQDAEREKRLTERLNEQENLSVILYVPAMATCTVILLNFIMCTLWVSARTNMF